MDVVRKSLPGVDVLRSDYATSGLTGMGSQPTADRRFGQARIKPVVNAFAELRPVFRLGAPSTPHMKCPMHAKTLATQRIRISALPSPSGNRQGFGARRLPLPVNVCTF